ncbi:MULTISPECIES: hypothetical protein [unclassified Microcoleus]|uniref:hypothetical protein n=1 Tax=unclassified Microcoleus TaxID=2642155 RepID=UPI002FCF5849
MRSGASRFGFYCRCAIVRLAIFIDFAVRDGSESQKTLFTFCPDAASTIELLMGASHLCSPPLEIGVLRQEAEGKRQKERGRRKEAEGRSQKKEGARRSIFTNMRCSPCD